MLDDHRLVGDEMRLDPDRQVVRDLRHLVRHILAEDEIVAALGHRDRQADRRLAVEAEHRLRRVGVAFGDRGDVGEAEELAVSE